MKCLIFCVVAPIILGVVLGFVAAKAWPAAPIKAPLCPCPQGGMCQCPDAACPCEPCACEGCAGK